MIITKKITINFIDGRILNILLSVKMIAENQVQVLEQGENNRYD